MDTRQAYIEKLEQQVSFQAQLIKDLLAKISFLEDKLSYYCTKKDSSNSSIPPSRDPHRVQRTESLRQSSGRKQGGQLGHKGSCLEMTAEPTEIIAHHPQYLFSINL